MVQKRKFFFVFYTGNDNFVAINRRLFCFIIKNPLLQFGNTPITADILASCYGHLSAPQKKIEALEHHGEIIRLRRGLYVVNKELTEKPYAKGLYGNHIYGPSYVSEQWASRWYGLIPEMVTVVTSVTTHRAKRFDTPIGLYTYHRVPTEYYNIGMEPV